MASKYAFKAEEATLERAETFDGCYRVFGACWIKTATTGEKG
jgi:hypothetical protein